MVASTRALSRQNALNAGRFQLAPFGPPASRSPHNATPAPRRRSGRIQRRCALPADARGHPLERDLGPAASGEARHRHPQGRVAAAAQAEAAMVDPECDPLEGMVQIDETSIVYRRKDDPVAAGAGRNHDGKPLVAGAAERKEDERPGRIRLSVISDFSGCSLKGFVAASTCEGATILTDAFSSCQGMERRKPPAQSRWRDGGARPAYRGSTASSPTSSGWRSASIMVSAAAISRLISTSSSSAGTEGAATASPSTCCSASD